MSINRRSIRAIALSLWIFHVVYNFSSFTSIQKTVPATEKAPTEKLKPSKKDKDQEVVIEDIGDEPINLDDIPF